MQRKRMTLRLDVLRRSLTIGAAGGVLLAAVSAGCLIVVGTVGREGLGFASLRDTVAALVIYPPIAFMLGGVVGVGAGAISGVGLALRPAGGSAPADARRPT